MRLEQSKSTKMKTLLKDIVPEDVRDEEFNIYHRFENGKFIQIRKKPTSSYYSMRSILKKDWQFNQSEKQVASHIRYLQR